MSDETPGVFDPLDVLDVEGRIEDGLSWVETLIQVYATQVQKLLRELLEDGSSSPDAEKQINKLEGVLKALTLAESRYDAFKSKRAGAAGQFALDLDEARSAIGERLARLRDAGGTDCFS